MTLEQLKYNDVLTYIPSGAMCKVIDRTPWSLTVKNCKTGTITVINNDTAASLYI